MFIKTNQYGSLQAACGIQLYFDTVLPVPQKIGNVTNLTRSDGISYATLSELPDSLNVGDKISISNLSIIPAFTIVPVPDSYIGSFTINSIDRLGQIITFNQNLANDNIGNVNGEIYKQNNISPAEKYIIEYSVETKVPSTSSVILRPSTLVENSDRAFTPTTVVEILSTYSLSSKALIKMIIRDLKSNQILKTEYQEIVVTDSESKPCEIIHEKPITISFYELNKKNNWSYFYEGYLLAQFIPNTEYKDITIKLIKKNNTLLPSRGGKNRIKIVVNPLAIQQKQTNIDKIREAIVSQYNIIDNAYAVVNLGNRSYDIIVEDMLLKPEDFKGIVVDVVPEGTGTPVKFEDVANAIPYSQDIYSIPKISLLRWNNNNTINFIGELHYNERIYDNDPLIVNISGSIDLSGTIRDVTNGINYIL